MEKPIVLPAFAVIDEWEEIIDGITLVYQIKASSGIDTRIWYFAACWQRGVPSPSVSGKFDECPHRKQVETRFSSASAEIIKRAIAAKNENPAFLYKKLPFFKENSPAKISDAVVEKPEKYHRYPLEIRNMLDKSERLLRQSRKIIQSSTILHERLSLLNERSRQFCKH